MSKEQAKTLGKVYLLGAGPGDAQLLTLKAKRLLEEAEVVVYDALVGQGILSWIPKETLAISVGKRAGYHSATQEEINQLLLEHALQGKCVVRLKGGDPFLFGRGGEELELLVQHQVPYEVVPGVTSSIAVPAYNGIPVTHRKYCSSVHIITGHKKTGSTLDLDFEALIRLNGTLVFLMGISALPDICNGLLKQGMDKATPAAVLQQGTTAGQKRILGTLETLEEQVNRQGILTPAIIVVGKVCELANEFAWYEKLPLAGCRVIVTRPKQHSSKMSALLRSKGAEVLELPAIATVPIHNNTKLQKAIEELQNFSWLAFTSPTGVEVFFDFLQNYGKDLRCLGSIKLAVIGEGTKNALAERGLLADFMPKVYDGDNLGFELSKLCKPGEKVLLPRAKEGNQKLVAYLTEAQVEVSDIPIYDTLYEQASAISISQEIEHGHISAVVFTSASTVNGFAAVTQGLDYSKVRAACIGKQTRERAKLLGMNTYVSEKATMESLVELVENMGK